MAQIYDQIIEMLALMGQYDDSGFENNVRWVAVQPRALDTGSCHHVWRGGSLPYDAHPVNSTLHTGIIAGR